MDVPSPGCCRGSWCCCCCQCSCLTLFSWTCSDCSGRVVTFPMHVSKMSYFIGEEKYTKWFLRICQKCRLLLTRKNVRKDSCACVKNVVFYWRGKMCKRISAHASKMLSFNDKEKCAKGFLSMRQKCRLLLARKNAQNIFCACFKNVVFYWRGKMRKMIPVHASKMLSFIGEEKCTK